MTACAVTIDLAAHQAAEDRAEARAAAVAAQLDDAIYTILAGAEHDDLDAYLIDAVPAAGPRRRTFRQLLDSAGLPAKLDCDRDWQRLIQLAPLERMALIVQAYREWCRGVWASVPAVLRMAEKLADEAAQDAAEDLASEAMREEA